MSGRVVVEVGKNNPARRPGAQFTIRPMTFEPAIAQRIHIVLVGTQHPGNIGSAARALKTMGLARLALVAPQRFPHADAEAMAAGADDVLAGAQHFATLQRTA